MTNINRIFYLTLMCVSCANLYAAATTDITGNYKCSVFDPKNNSHYDEKLNIAKTGETYRLQFYPMDRSIPYILGTGLVSGSAFSAINWEPSSTWVGSELFSIKADGTLDGTWATINTTLVGTETCSKI